MKTIIKTIAVLLITAVVFNSCKKESVQVTPPPPLSGNLPPVAKAGDDRLITYVCPIPIMSFDWDDYGNTGKTNFNNFELYGGGSYDPDGNMLNYKWIAITGPQGYSIKSPTNKNTLIENASFGKYEFELTVTDGGGLSTKDSVIIIFNWGSDLDITLNTTYKFYDNVSDPGGGRISERNFDLTEIFGKPTLSQLGEFDLYFGQFADTATLSDKIYLNYFRISQGPLIISGFGSINFKKLIRDGGGPFSGTFTVTNGSATECSPNIFSSLPPLQLSGSLNVTTGIVSLNIKGKTYF
jgi:hypothetical protein